MDKKLYTYFSLAAFIFIIDRVSKIAALRWCAESAHAITPFLSFDLVFNRGVSWGVLHSSCDTVLYAVVVMIVCITAALCWYAYDQYRQGRSIIGHVCIIAGSCSNLIDRVVYHGVIDFIIVSYGDISWPVFNCADVAIVLGVAMVIFQYEE